MLTLDSSQTLVATIPNPLSRQNSHAVVFRENTLAPGAPDLMEEVQRAEAYLDEISAKVSDPHVDLATIMRLNIWRKELEAYLTGLRYALGESDPLPLWNEEFVSAVVR